MSARSSARSADFARRETADVRAKTGPEGLALWLIYAELGLTVFCILMFSNALIGPVFAPQNDLTGVSESDSAILRVMWLPVYAVTVALIAIRVTRLMRILPGLFMTGLLVGLCFASNYWSIAPDITIRRTIALAFTTLFGLYLASRWRGEDLVQIVAGSFALLAFGSYFVCIAVPSLGIHTDINAGAWKGLWYEKNQMAAMMVLGFIAACASAYVSPERRKAWIGVAVMIFLLVVLSRSKTSLLACMVSAAAIPLLLALQRGGVLSIIFTWLAATAAMVGAALFYIMPDQILKLLGKDPTLTGRTEIWASLMRLSDKHPWLGYGYKAFWTPDSVPAAVVRAETHWEVPSAHNGWLDLLIQLGWTGVTLFGAVLAAGFFCALFRFAKVRDGFFSVLILMLFSFLILSESFILSQNSLIWALFVCALARLTANAVEE
ncbi:O-antigen ligase [Asticcacaulis sp. 201]|uniref:O-antigen ligase family protein n=1 Tax=Asticcacaulis sp. 201 TaxID=3028787 RepID=UPI0029162BF6|nr:O-antigen ligase [Asticcacaulis sp. 201]MDV6330556.1 O-antigen ligase [Asticcacaulis sp. 201]